MSQQIVHTVDGAFELRFTKTPKVFSEIKGAVIIKVYRGVEEFTIHLGEAGHSPPILF